MSNEILGKNGKPLHGAAKTAALNKISKEIQNKENHGLIEIDTKSMSNEDLTIVVMAHQETLYSILGELKKKNSVKSVTTKSAQAILSGLFLSSISTGIFCLVSPDYKEIGALAGFMGGASARILFSENE